MFRADREKRIHPLPETGRILLPQQIMQEDPHGVHAQPLGPPQLLVDLLRIKRRRLPHFEFVDGILRHEVAAHQPRLLLVPAVGLVVGPALGVGGEPENSEKQDGDETLTGQRLLLRREGRSALNLDFYLSGAAIVHEQPFLQYVAADQAGKEWLS
jgi:hypothetical protein